MNFQSTFARGWDFDTGKYEIRQGGDRGVSERAGDGKDPRWQRPLALLSGMYVVRHWQVEQPGSGTLYNTR